MSISILTTTSIVVVFPAILDRNAEQQALRYAETLDVPCAYSTNGDASLEHDRTRTSGDVEKAISLDQFPSPDDLGERYRASKGYSAAQEVVMTQDYYDDGSGKSPRYYQQVAINRSVDAIARGQNRILLVMATGSGKTYTAPNHLTPLVVRC
jgi:type I restriction enzyme, R subunit